MILRRADDPVACTIALCTAIVLTLFFRRILAFVLERQRKRNPSQGSLLYTRVLFSSWLLMVILASGIAGFFGLFHIPIPTWLK